MKAVQLTNMAAPRFCRWSRSMSRTLVRARYGSPSGPPVNPSDWKRLAGQYRDFEEVTFPSGIGVEASGVVDEVGAGVSGVSVGDAVFGCGEHANAMAQYAVLTDWAHKPEKVSFEVASGLSVIGDTAMRALDEVGVPRTAASARPSRWLPIPCSSSGPAKATRSARPPRHPQRRQGQPWATSTMTSLSDGTLVTGARSAMPPTQTPWTNRIVAHGEEAPDKLIAHEFNWRTHTTNQRHALASVLNEVGLVQSVVVNRTTGRLVDGHLRVELAKAQGQPTIPVVYVELSEEEERIILTTLDPIAAMATADRQRLTELLKASTTRTWASCSRRWRGPTASPWTSARSVSPTPTRSPSRRPSP